MLSSPQSSQLRVILVRNCITVSQFWGSNEVLSKEACVSKHGFCVQNTLSCGVKMGSFMDSLDQLVFPNLKKPPKSQISQTRQFHLMWMLHRFVLISFLPDLKHQAWVRHAGFWLFHRPAVAQCWLDGITCF